MSQAAITNGIGDASNRLGYKEKQSKMALMAMNELLCMKPPRRKDEKTIIIKFNACMM